MYYYKFNIHLYEGLKWNNKVAATKSCKFKYFESVQKVRRFRKMLKIFHGGGLIIIKLKDILKISKNGGWHFFKR